MNATVNEVSTQSARLLLDALERQAIDPHELWRDLPVDVAMLQARRRIDWPTWVAMMAEVARVTPVPMDELFAPGSGTRSGHPFVRVAQGLLSLRDMYSFVARWGVRRAVTIMRGRFEQSDPTHARFTLAIDPGYEGSEPTLQFVTGMLRQLPTLHGQPPALLRVVALTPHRIDCELTLPLERSLVSRARRVLGVFGSMATALDELEHQTNELDAKTIELDQQLTAIRERDEWLEVALDAGKIGLWRWDPATRRVRISGRLLDWLGTGDVTEVDTAIWTARIHPEDQPRTADLMRQSLATRAPFETEYRLARPDGEMIWLRLTGRIQTDARGRIYAYGSAADITDEKLMDSRLRMADRLIAAGTLAAGLAHEINNPLTYVRASVELMRRGLAPFPVAAEAIKDLSAQVIDGVDRIRAVVADVRSFARHEEEAVGPVDPRLVCAAAIRIVGLDVRHRAMITTQLDATPSVVANEAKLGQVLINLLVNASQAMPPRPVAENLVTVRTRTLPGGDVAIDVEDNGTGIAPGIVARLFDPFFTTKPVGLGTGLGLSVCQGIVASLGGRIDVTTELGHGSRFTVVLPAMAAAPSPTVITTASPSTASPPPAGHVLVIDDEPMIRQVVARSLASHGYAVDEAENGREGLSRALGATEYQVILCDLMMPDIDGATLYEQLAANRPRLVPRVVFISGGAVTERMRLFIERPDVTVLRKPFALERLVAAIERAAEA